MSVLIHKKVQVLVSGEFMLCTSSWQPGSVRKNNKRCWSVDLIFSFWHRTRTSQKLGSLLYTQTYGSRKFQSTNQRWQLSCASTMFHWKKLCFFLGSARQARKFKEPKSGEFFVPLLWNWRRTRRRWKGKRLIVLTENWRRWVNLVTSFFILIFLTLLPYTGLKPIYWLKLLKSTEMAETNWGNSVIGLVFFEGVICTGLVTGTIIFGCTD